MASILDEFKPLIDQWLAATPGLLATRIRQDLVRDYGFEGGYTPRRRYVERSRPRPPPRQERRFETRPGHQAQVDWSHEEPITTSSGLELPLCCFSHDPRAVPGLVLRVDRARRTWSPSGRVTARRRAFRGCPARVAL